MKKIAFLIEDISELSGGKRVAVNLANELSKYYNVCLNGCLGNYASVKSFIYTTLYLDE